MVTVWASLFFPFPTSPCQGQLRERLGAGFKFHLIPFTEKITWYKILKQFQLTWKVGTTFWCGSRTSSLDIGFTPTPTPWPRSSKTFPLDPNKYLTQRFISRKFWGLKNFDLAKIKGWIFDRRTHFLWCHGKLQLIREPGSWVLLRRIRSNGRHSELPRTIQKRCSTVYFTYFFTSKPLQSISRKFSLAFCGLKLKMFCFDVADSYAPYNVGAPYIFFGELKFGLWKKKAKNPSAHQCPPARPCGIKWSWKNTSFITKRWVAARSWSEVIQCLISLVDLQKGPKIPLQKIEKFCYKT